MCDIVTLYLLQLFGLTLTSSLAFPFSSSSRELKWDYDDVMSGLGRKLRTLGHFPNKATASHPKSCSNFNLNFLKTMMSLAFLKTCKDFSSFYRTPQASLLQISDDPTKHQQRWFIVCPWKTSPGAPLKQWESSCTCWWYQTSLIFHCFPCR